jgi:hypothetical protein
LPAGYCFSFIASLQASFAKFKASFNMKKVYFGTSFYSKCGFFPLKAGFEASLKTVPKPIPKAAF